MSLTRTGRAISSSSDRFSRSATMVYVAATDGTMSPPSTSNIGSMTCTKNCAGSLANWAIGGGTDALDSRNVVESAGSRSIITWNSGMTVINRSGRIVAEASAPLLRRTWRSSLPIKIRS